MTDVEQILAMEAIKRVKSRYFYYLDHKDWDGWRRDVFAPDATLEVGEAMEEPIKGAEAIIAWVSSRAVGQVSIHHGHMPDIEITSDTTAKAVWAMEDLVFKPLDTPLNFTQLHGWGHYHETYVKLSQGWRIKSTKLTRLRVLMTK